MLNAVIIDDEPRAIDLIESYCKRIPELFCMASFRDPVNAITFIEKNLPDLVFLDINMPRLSGVQLAKIIPANCRIIFTTAYSEYAVESYHLEATDYLLKPISFERMLQAVKKAKKLISQETIMQKAPEKEMLVIKSGYQVYQIPINEILFLEKEGNYITYTTVEQSVLARESIGEALNRLPESFIRVHKSYIVNIHKVKLLDGKFVHLGKNKVPISKRYIKKVKDILNAMG